MKKLLVLIFMICLWSSCQSEETKFQKCETQFNNNWNQLYEDLPFVSNAIYDVEKLKDEKPFLDKTLKAFDSIDETALPEMEQTEFLEIKKLVEERAIFLETKIKKDPSVFSLKKELENLMSKNNLESALTTIEKMPQHFEFAKSSLQQPELEKIEKALEEQKATYFLLKNEMPQWVKKNANTALALNHFLEKNREAMLSIKDWIGFLNSEKFEIGNEIIMNDKL